MTVKTFYCSYIQQLGFVPQRQLPRIRARGTPAGINYEDVYLHQIMEIPCLFSNRPSLY